jgi:hypothetical protein
MNLTRAAWRPVRRGLKLGLVLSLAGGLLACSSLGVNPASLGGTAQALAQTAQAAGGTALAGVPGTATVLAATVEAKLTQLAPTLESGGHQAGTALANLPGTAAALSSQLVPTGEALATQAAAAAGTAVADPAQASAAITAYAQQVLGISVTIVKAGGLTGDIQHLIVLPQGGSTAQAATAKVAAQTYGAIINGGAASVSYGSGALSGDLNVDINSASLGAFTLDASAGPQSAAEALQVALQTFPALAGQSYTSFPVTQGYAWFAQGNVQGYNKNTKQPGLVAQAMLLSVVPLVLRHTLVSVVVGKGDFASNLIP